MKSSIKSIIIKVSIAFLAIIALLTYFSGTIDNYLLPHVTCTFAGEGTLKYDLRTTSVFEPSDSLTADGSELRFRFTCDPSLNAFMQIGASVNVKASVQVGKDEYAYRSGVAVIVGKRETEEGIECTAELKSMELEEGEEMPVFGDMVIIDNTFESQRYRHILMKSAIQNGSYVYVVTEGDDHKRYVKQTPVTILAESDFYAAVDMDADMLPIVLTSTKEIHDGQRVTSDG